MDKSIDTRPSTVAARDWRRSLREAVRDWPTLAQLLDLPLDAIDGLTPARGEFPLLVPRSFVARMRRGEPRDPLLLQVLPRAVERLATIGYGDDPLGEVEIARTGMLQKYPRRALLITTASCPVHCRYCFRRAFPYSHQLAARDAFAPALDALARSAGMHEVILSGGDPLSLSNRRLGELIDALARLPNLRTVRIHTRFPIMIPERVDDGLLALLARSRLNKVIVVHTNHPREIDAEVDHGLRMLGNETDVILNQSVLLAGVNDDAATLTSLSEALFASGVLPYYLHLLDQVTGTAHFEVEASRGLELIASMRERLPGYLVPRLVREVPGELSKTPVS